MKKINTINTILAEMGKFRKIFCLLIFTLLYPYFIHAQTTDYGLANPPGVSSTLSAHDLEDLWESVDLESIQAEPIAKYALKGKDVSLWLQFIAQKMDRAQFLFFQKGARGEISNTDINAYIATKRAEVEAYYQQFNLVKNTLSLVPPRKFSPLKINGPCTNIGFEDGTSGWTGFTGSAECGRNPSPCNEKTGFDADRHVITDTSMVDPYIPGLSMVAPGGTQSIRLENYVDGGDASGIRQTFMVTATNNIFTYRYAAVLEDPGDHKDNERPYFKVRMFDENGDEISCATYTALAKPPIDNFTYVKAKDVESRDYLDLYYRDWTTVSIPLVDYVGQNVTIEFTVADCAKGGHLGYAYVDAECGALTPLVPLEICGSQNISFDGPEGFAAYSWTGPGIVGSSDEQGVTVNKAGIYKVQLIPYSDNPCPTSLTVTIAEHCSPPPIATELCEDIKGSGSVSGVNLNDYNKQITAFNADAKVSAWHSAFPALSSNKIATPKSVKVTNGAKFYAVITYPYPGSDTAEIDFTVHSLPLLTFPAISPSCEGSAAFQLKGLNPAGGSFSGTNTTASGIFSPSDTGSYKITYHYTDVNGCTDSVFQVALVQGLPTVDAGLGKTLCETMPDVSLAGLVTNASGVTWSGGAGTFASGKNTPEGLYTPTASEISAGSLTLLLTAASKGVCPDAKDAVTFKWVKAPTVDAGADQRICATATEISLTGLTTNQSKVTWGGGKGVFTPMNTSLAVKYKPTASEKTAGEVALVLLAVGDTPCPSITDTVNIQIDPEPVLTAKGPNTVCKSNPQILLTGTIKNALGVQWSGGGATFSPSATSLTPSYTPTKAELNASSITFLLTSTGNGVCSPVSKTVVVGFVDIPTVLAGVDQSVCGNNATVALQGKVTVADGGEWIGGTGTFSPGRNALSAKYIPSEAEIKAGKTTLYLQTTGNGNCAAVRDTMMIDITPAPIVYAGPDMYICPEITSVHLAPIVNNASSVLWEGGQGMFNPGVTSMSPEYIVASAEKGTKVSLALTASAPGCIPVSDTVAVSFYESPVVDAGKDQIICKGASAQIIGKTSLAGTVSWNTLSGTVISGVSLATIHANSDTSYIFKATTANGCKNEDTVAITTVSAPVFSPGGPFCLIDKLTINTNPDQIPAVPATITWTRSGNIISGEKDYSLTATEAGIYKLLFSYGECSATASYEVNKAPELVLPAELSNCIGFPITVNANAISGAVYTWTIGQTTLPENGASIQVNAKEKPFNVYVTVTDQNACSDLDSVRLSGKPSPVLNLKDQAVCDKEKVNLNATPSNTIVLTEPIEYNWFREGTFITSGSPFFSTGKAGTYSVSVTSSGCTSLDTAMVTIYPLPVIDLPRENTFCSDNGNFVIIDAGKGDRFIWSTGDTAETIKLNYSGIFSVQKISKMGCVATGETRVIDACPPQLHISNAFSPNLDGANDAYNVYSEHVGKFQMLIFNRWGEIIFESKDKGLFWDGSYRGEPMPIGVYPWIITYEGDSEAYKGPYKKEGSVTVIR